MGQLLLVKYALPAIDEARPSREWVLSAEGRARCVWLGRQWRSRDVEQAYASCEPKALETARLAAAVAGIEALPRGDLHENDRTGLGFLPRGELQARIRTFFAEPAQLIIGLESAQMALRRFEDAVRAAVDGRTLAIVAHGTVITLLVAAYNEVDPFALWSRLDLPSYVVLDPDTFAWDGAVINAPR